MNIKRDTGRLLLAISLALSYLVLSVLPVAAAAGADLDQYANKGGSWVNGNLGDSKATYYEGDSVPYRLKLTGLTTGATSHTVTIEWDATKGGKHAFDYLTTYNRTVTGANPCAGLTCSAPTTNSGAFTLFGGTITNVSAPSTTGSPDGDSSASVVVTFTAASADLVLAW
ncbi:MAG TPA: hypothetical protein VHS28_04045, partial [Chloroflexota bacterium]|nr:hypothetical protein [Chloroflexota bacterium]